MKKLLGLVALLLPSLCFADRLGSLRSSADVILTTQAAASLTNRNTYTSSQSFIVSGNSYSNIIGISSSSTGSPYLIVSTKGVVSLGTTANFVYRQTTPLYPIDLECNSSDPASCIYVSHSNGNAIQAVGTSNNPTLLISNNTAGASASAVKASKLGVAGIVGEYTTDVATAVYASATSGTAVRANSSSGNAIQVDAGNVQLNTLSASANICTDGSKNLTTSGCSSGLLTATQTWSGQNNWTTPAQSTFTYGLAAGSFTLTGTGNAIVQGTIAPASGIVASTFTVIWTSGSYTVGQSAVFSSTNGTVIGGSSGGGTPSGLNKIQYDSNGSFAGLPSVVTASSVTVISTISFTANGDQNASPSFFDILGPTNVGNKILGIGTPGQNNQVTFPDRQMADMSTYGANLGGLAVGDVNNSFPYRIYTNGDPNDYIDLRTATKSTITFNTGTVTPGALVFNPGGVTMLSLTTPTGATFDSTVTVNGNLIVNSGSIQNPSITGVTLSSGITIGLQSIITANTTMTSTMSVVEASCTAKGTANTGLTLTLPAAASNSGRDFMIYDVGTDSCVVTVKGNGTDLIESTGTIQLNAQFQHASLHSLGAVGWGSGLGGIQYTPWSVFTTQDDVGSFTIGTSSAVYQCPVYIPVPVAVLGFRADRGTGLTGEKVSFGIWNMNFGTTPIVSLSTQTPVGGPSNYLLSTVYNLSPGWYRIGIAINNATTAYSGSNSVAQETMFCSIGATPTGTGVDLTTITLAAGGTRNRTYPAVDLLINGGSTGN